MKNYENTWLIIKKAIYKIYNNVKKVEKNVEISYNVNRRVELIKKVIFST